MGGYSEHVVRGVMARSAWLAIVAIIVAAAAAAAATGSMRGRAADPNGLPLPGATISVSSIATGVTTTTVTDEQGAYTVDVPPGRYRVRVDLSGFQPAECGDVVGGDDPAVVDFVLALAAFQEQVTVSAEAPRALLTRPQPDAPVLVTREVIDAAMLPNSQYDDVLPLMPNVVRGPDGLISVAGARAPQGSLVVDGFNETDPISGVAGLMLPLEAVDSMQVYGGGYPAALGAATGGVTTVVTRAGSDRIHMSANSFFPRMLFENGTIHGVEYWEPNAGISGPIVKGRAYFEQAVSYRFDRNRFGTLAGPQTNKYDALLSWTRLDVQLAPGQRASATASFDPQHTDRANITAFTSAEAAPRLDQGGWSGALADRLTFGTRTTLEVRAGMIQTESVVLPNGAGAYLVGHDLTRGSYFDRRDLHGRRAETGATATWTTSNGHLVAVGGTVTHATLEGGDASAAVDLLRSDGTVSRTIEFLPGGALAASTGSIAAFVQDSWSAAPGLTIDAGVRYERVTAAAGATIEPRVGATIKAPGGHTSVSGSAGVFADKLPLAALAFAEFPERIVTSFDAAGLGATPLVLQNAFGGSLRVPRATRWDVAIDRDFPGGWLGRVKYQERHGRDELVVDPNVTSPSGGVLALGSDGTSQSRSVEATVGCRRPSGGDEVYVSYVRSATRGDLNSVDAMMGAFAEPFVQPNQSGPLPMDVPHRLLAWGLLRAPARITVAPFVEIRSGFPYSAIDDEWAYVGSRDRVRLPWFGSLDLYVNKIVGLPGRLPDARIGLKLYNLLSIHTAREVQRDVSRADFGTTYNPIPRDFTMVFELLWGRR